MKRRILVTGSTGAIGSAITQKYKALGWAVCGIDQVSGEAGALDHFIESDLNQLVIDEEYKENVISNIVRWLDGDTLDVLVNNAAYQYVTKIHPMPTNELSKSYNINLIAPYLLITNLLNVFTEKTASVVNIGSIHSRLTKPGFVSYSTTKAALSALTKGLAIDFGDRIRINCIEPASVETPMLLDGFRNFPEKKKELEGYHPQQRISQPQEIANLVYFISSESIRFLHGSCIEISGGIASRLHDPV